MLRGILQVTIGTIATLAVCALTIASSGAQATCEQHAGGVAAAVVCAIANAKQEPVAGTVCDETAVPGKRALIYISDLTVRDVSCEEAVEVVQGFHKCRQAPGSNGQCSEPVIGYTCVEERPAAERTADQYVGHVSCQRDGAPITHSYTERTG